MSEGSRTDGDVVVDGVALRYHVVGEGHPVVFVQGVYVGGSLWDGVVTKLDGMRCIVPTWPLGAHRDPAPDADVSARSKGARRDALRLTQSLEPSVTLDAVDALRTFSKPVLIAWGDQDKLFPLEHARRPEADFPDARLEVIAGSSTYVMLDRPDELASAVLNFMA